ncbi:MAG: LrgB family protein [Rickettsiales bacterium]|jgi:putative effector of murein hydrolase|nr:LrgB family protein [Rickettsiales bacterium]
MIGDSVYFGFFLTLLVFSAAVMLNRKYNVSITTPLLTSTIAIILLLKLTGVPYSAYNHGAKYLYYFMAPAIVCFAVPMYRQIKLISEYKWVVMTSILFGSMVSVLSVVLLSKLFGLGGIIMKSLVTVSTTAAIGADITRELGGIVGFTIFATISTGVLGNAVGRQLAGFLGLRNPAAKGLAMGNSSHAAGTAKALEMGRVEGAFSSLSVGISGLLTAVLVPVIIWLFS